MNGGKCQDSRTGRELMLWREWGMYYLDETGRELMLWREWRDWGMYQDRKGAHVVERVGEWGMYYSDDRWWYIYHSCLNLLVRHLYHFITSILLYHL